jgi:hypothetical protein
VSHYGSKKDLIRQLLKHEDHHEQILGLLTFIATEGIEMSAALDALKASVLNLEAQVTALPVKLANTDSAELPAITTRVQSAADALAAL